MQNRQKALSKWRKILIWLAMVLTLAKVWLPDSIIAPLQNQIQKADSILRSVQDVFNGRPHVAKGRKYAPASKGRYTGQVDSVHDGDTIHVKDNNGYMHKIRLASIDAPEIKQAYGIASRDALKTRIEGKSVAVNVVAIDQYQREVGQIMLSNEDINLWMVQQGYAWHYDSIAKKQQDRLSFSHYQQAQLQARQKRLGLWHNARAIAPWQFRQQQKTANRTTS